MNNSTNGQQNTPVDKANIAVYNKRYRLDNKDILTVKRKQYNLNNKFKIAINSKQWYLDNKNILAVKRKQYKLYNKDILAVKRKQYRLNNKAKIAAYDKQYRLNNKDILNVKCKQYNKQRCKTDLLYKIKRKLRSVIWNAFKRIGKNKPAHTEQLLGCSWIEAKAHFELLFQEGMSWDNHGEWHIDHIRPVASFKVDELHLMNHISNLQPLWAEENLGSKKVSDKVKWSL